MSSKMEVEIELRHSAEKLWNSIKHFATVFPKAMPQIFERIDVLEGDGESVGSVLLSTYKQAESNSIIKAAKQRIELVDDEKKTVSYSVLEGDHLNYCKNFKGTFCVKGKIDGALVKYSAEFDQLANAQVSLHDFVRQFIVQALQSLDAYLLKA